MSTTISGTALNVATITSTSATLTTPTIDSAQVPTISGTAPLYMCRAWINFNGTGTVAIRGSGNVSSITDNGVGDYTVNFTTAMPDVNYSIVALSSNTTIYNQFVQIYNLTTPTASLVRIRANASLTSGTNDDPTYMSVAVFR